MKTIGVIGNWGDSNTIGGQITKTRELLKAISDKMGYDSKRLLGEWEDSKKITNDLYFINVGQQRGVIKLLVEILKLMRQSDYVIIILASKGYFQILPIISLINKLYQKRIYEFVIGGIRYDFLNYGRIKYEQKIKKIYVESTYMVKKYNELGLKNVEYMPNFKFFKTITEKEIEKRNNSQIRICTFSRIDRCKGIDVAVEIVKNVVSGNENIFLDVIGPVDSEYQEDFDNLINNVPDNIKYLGAINGSKAVEVLKEYDILLFPTKWKSEGFPGSFIDAMAAGLVILSSERINFKDIICEGVNGFLFNENDIKAFADKIIYLKNNIDILRSMQKNALCEVEKYKTENVLEKFWCELNL